MKLNFGDVFIADASDGHYLEMVKYCSDNNMVLTETYNTDVSDVSAIWDTMAIFRFKNISDATIFKLRYK